MYRPTPNFIMSLTVILIAVTLVFLCIRIVSTAQAHALEHQAKIAMNPSPRQGWRPDIRHCLVPNVNTWNCIRNKTSRSGTGSTITSSKED